MPHYYDRRLTDFGLGRTRGRSVSSALSRRWLAAAELGTDGRSVCLLLAGGCGFPWPRSMRGRPAMAIVSFPLWHGRQGEGGGGGAAFVSRISPGTRPRKHEHPSRSRAPAGPRGPRRCVCSHRSLTALAWPGASRRRRVTWGGRVPGRACLPWTAAFARSLGDL